jgi:hypothetical protein
MNSHKLQVAVYCLAITMLGSCLSPELQFQQSAASDSAELCTEAERFSLSKGPGASVEVLGIDLKTTRRVVGSVPQPFRLRPGAHSIVYRLEDKWGTERDGVLNVNLRPSNTYVLRAGSTKTTMLLMVVNTTGPGEIIERVIEKARGD